MRRLLILARAVLLGWVALLLMAYLVERPLLIWTAPLLDVSWIATVHLMLDCLTLTATGCITGYFNRPRAVAGVLVFAATLALWDFEPLLALNIPWMVRLISNTFRDSRYLESLATTAATQALLLGSLIAGGVLSRGSVGPINFGRSIIEVNRHKEIQ